MIKLLLAALAGSIATASFMKRGRADQRVSAPPSLPQPAREMHLPQQGSLVMTPPDRNGNNVYYGS